MRAFCKTLRHIVCIWPFFVSLAWAQKSTFAPKSITVNGIISNFRDVMGAAVTDNDTGQQYPFMLGETITGFGQIILIKEKEIVLKNGDHEKTYLLNYPYGVMQNHIAVPFPTAKTKSSAEPKTNFLQSEITEITKRQQLMSSITAAPSYEKGQFVGVQLQTITENSFFATVGLQANDILRQVNEMKIQNSGQFMQVLQNLDQGSSVTLEVLRNGQPMTVTYKIH